MKKTLMAAIVLSACHMLNGAAMADAKLSAEDIVSEHMVAEAMLTAHFIDAALRAGMERDEINAVLTRVASRSVVSEFWVSDEEGRIIYSNVEGAKFTFPTDSGAGTQAAPFAALLDGTKTIVIQAARPRELDGAIFKYVGVSGIDKRRIVQVGVSASEMGNR